MSSAASVAAFHAQPRQSRFRRNLAAANADGRLGCSIEAHHREYHWTDPTTQRRFTDVQRKPLYDLYDMMMPQQSAKCPCLKAACEAQWNRNFHGAYTTTAISPGSYTKGLDSAGAVPRKVYSLPYSLKPDVLKYLISRFPEWFFVCRFARAHDHPIAHTSTRIAGERIMDKLVRGTADEPCVYVDLNGNPGANESYMARNPGVKIITIVEAVTPKDYVGMVVKWGPRLNAAGLPRWHMMSVRDIGFNLVGPLVGVKVHGFISIHTTYYYDKAEIATLLRVFDCPMFSAMHRFQGMQGTLNNGEQQFEKRVCGTRTTVYQTNVSTGATYFHPDNSMWFDHDSFTVGPDGVGWDANLLCDETFVFTVVYCPAVQCLMSEKCLAHVGVIRTTELDPDPGHTAQSQAQIAASNEVRVSLCGVSSTVPIASSHVAFFGSMRTAVIGRARNPRQYADHVSRCKIQAADKVKNKGLIIDAQQLDTIARYSFWIDFADQHGADKLMVGQSYAKVIAADALYKDGGGHVLRNTFSCLAGMVLSAAEVFSGAADTSSPSHSLT